MIAAFAAGFQPNPLAFQLADFGGRSGYWRLVFAKLQEEALAPPAKEEEKKPEATTTETKPSPVTKPKVVRRRPSAPPPPEIHERPVLPVVMNRPVRTLLDDLIALPTVDLRPIRIDYSRVAARVAGEEVQRTRRRRRQIEELLLLAVV